MKIKIKKDIDLSKVILLRNTGNISIDIDSFVDIIDDDMCKKYISTGTKDTDFINNYYGSGRSSNKVKQLSYKEISSPDKIMNYLFYKENEEASSYFIIKTFIINESIANYSEEEYEILKVILYFTNYLCVKNIENYSEFTLNSKPKCTEIKILLIFNDGYQYVTVNNYISDYFKNVKEILSLILKAQNITNVK